MYLGLLARTSPSASCVGCIAAAIAANRLIRMIPLPCDWQEQRSLLRQFSRRRYGVLAVSRRLVRSGDVVGIFPLQWCGILVVLTDVSHEFLVQVFDAGEY